MSWTLINFCSTVFETKSIPCISYSGRDILSHPFFDRTVFKRCNVLMLWGGLRTDVSGRISWHNDFDEVT